MDEIGVTYPNDTSTETDNRNIEEHLIRLITRLMFVWFIKQKQLVPEDIFDAEKLPEYLLNFEPNSKVSGIYYNAILQNMFFATLNRQINKRGWAANSSFGKEAAKNITASKRCFAITTAVLGLPCRMKKSRNCFVKCLFLMEREIDRLVYELYGLTEAENGIIEAY